MKLNEQPTEKDEKSDHFKNTQISVFTMPLKKKDKKQIGFGGLIIVTARRLS